MDMFVEDTAALVLVGFVGLVATLVAIVRDTQRRRSPGGSAPASSRAFATRR